MTDPLDRFRRAAKTLKAEYEAGAPGARVRIAAVRPRADNADLKHADYLHTLAREENFATWPAMKNAVEAEGLDRAQRIQRLKIALQAGQTGVVRSLIDQTPDLAKDHFGLLCALVDVRAVRQSLQNDPSRAITSAGPSLPLVHLCRSRMFSVRSGGGSDSVAIAQMLVAHGANVNAGSVRDGAPLSPLYWALGHAGNMDLAQWLLENGADPNDSESLYHATELGHVDGVQLLLRHGADPKVTNALPRAMDFNNVEMVQLLLEGGADPNEGSDAWRKTTGMERGVPVLHQAARRMNTGPVLDLLLSHGADPAATWQGHSVYAFARVFGNVDLARRIEDRGQATQLTETEQMLATAATGQVPDGFIDTAKLPDAYRALPREILHLSGKLPHLRALVAIGLDWDRPDTQGVTPVQAAGWSGLPEVLAYFLSLAPNLGHVNDYGGTLLSTILHGADNNPIRADGDYVGCLRLALDHGVALPRKAIEASDRADITAFLRDWAADKPGQVVDHGIV